MINNYYTLLHVLDELRRRSSGMALAQPFTQARHELILPFEPAGGSGEPFVAVVSCEPTANVLFLKDSFGRARRNSTDIFPGLEGALISAIVLHPADREARISLRHGPTIVVQLFGSRANVLLTDTAGTVTASFLRTKTTTGAVLPDVPSGDGAPTSREFLDAAREQPALLLSTALKRSFPRLGGLLIREALFRAGIDGPVHAGDLTPAALEALASIAVRLDVELRSPPTPGVYYRELEPVEFVLRPLRHLEQFRFEPSGSLSAGIRAFLGRRSQRSGFHEQKERLLAAIQRELEFASTTADRIRGDLPDPAAADLWERQGKLVQAHAHELSKGMKEAVVEDTLSPGREIVSIPLDPFLTPGKNIERLFTRARKAREQRSELAGRLQELDGRTKVLAALAEQLDAVETGDELATFLTTNGPALKDAGVRTATPGAGRTEPSPPFRVYIVEGGFQVWAGKSGENNDLLTTRHTAKNDLWFHARGVGGSHVVLKAGTGKGHISKRAKEQAAAIAAYYSKMKKAQHVPVSMCEGKYVRKPRGADVGSVTIEHEEVLFVQPALPGAEQ